MCESTSYDRDELVRSGGKLWAPPLKNGGNLRPVVSDGEGGYKPTRARGGGQTARRVAGGGKSNKKTAPAKGASKKRTR